MSTTKRPKATPERLRLDSHRQSSGETSLLKIKALVDRNVDCASPSIVTNQLQTPIKSGRDVVPMTGNKIPNLGDSTIHFIDIWKVELANSA